MAQLGAWTLEMRTLRAEQTSDEMSAAGKLQDTGMPRGGCFQNGYIPTPVSATGQTRCSFLAHHDDPGIDQEGRYRRVTGPPCETRKTAAYET